MGIHARAPGSPADKHIVANVDESEPGTFKDRALIDGDPFSLIEAMTIAAYAVGAENGWIFVRGEYPRSFERLSNAVEKARQRDTWDRIFWDRKGSILISRCGKAQGPTFAVKKRR